MTVPSPLSARRDDEADGYGRLPPLALFAAFGLLLIAFADGAARDDRAWAPVAFWLGLLTIVTPIAARLMGRSAPRRERIALVLVVAMALYLVKLLHSPDGFSFFDEFHHWATLNDIVTTGRLFTHNNILPASPYYPGLEVLTSPLVSFGWNPWEAGIVVLGICRVFFGLVLFLLFERVSGSARIAGLAALLYMANPSFLFFDSQFAYESLALPLAICVLWLIARRENGPRTGRVGLTIAFLLIMVATVTSHHITSIALAAFLAVWAATTVILRAGRHVDAPGIVGPAMIAVTMTIGWTLYVATVTVGYLAPAVGGAVGQVVDLIVGEAGGRELFRTASGLAAPPLEQVAGYGSVGLLLLTLPFGVWFVWRRSGTDPAAMTLALAALLYPATLVARLTTSGAELAARSQEFIFLGVGFAVAHVALVIVDEAERRRSAAFVRRLLPAGAAILFVGGAVVGQPFWARMPGPYLVSADPRSIEPQSVAAAEWTVGRIGPDARFVADRVNRALLKTFGRQHPISAVGDRVDVKDPYFSTVLGAPEERILAAARVAYVIADHRLTTALPTVGVYVERGEIKDGAHSEPLPAAAIDKWDGAEHVDRIFDSGSVVIYDVHRLTATVAQ